jgi:hypothetical protein
MKSKATQEAPFKPSDEVIKRPTFSMQLRSKRFLTSAITRTTRSNQRVRRRIPQPPVLDLKGSAVYEEPRVDQAQCFKDLLPKEEENWAQGIENVFCVDDNDEFEIPEFPLRC